MVGSLSLLEAVYDHFLGTIPHFLHALLAAVKLRVCWFKRAGQFHLEPIRGSATKPKLYRDHIVKAHNREP